MTVLRKPCGQCGKGRALERYVGTKGTICDTCRKATSRATARRNHLLKTYGITQDEYDGILAAQGGVCATCGGRRPYSLAVDHDHVLERELLDAGLEPRLAARGSVRGLICKRENAVLRDLRDNPQILVALADYVRDPPARRVLAHAAIEHGDTKAA